MPTLIPIPDPRLATGLVLAIKDVPMHIGSNCQGTGQVPAGAYFGAVTVSNCQTYTGLQP